MLKIENLTYGYSKTPVLQGIDLTIGTNNICGLLGQNGVGKTTLIHLIQGLIFPWKGSTLTWNGYEPREREAQFLQQVYYVPDKNAIPDMDADTYAKLHGKYYPTFDMKVFHDCLLAFEVGRNTRMDRLSFGNAKKVLLSFAIATNTSLLLLDEPTNELDITAKSTFRKLLAQTMTDDKLIIISTHQARELQTNFDSIVILDHTHVLLHASFADIEEHLSLKLETSVADNNPDRLYTERVQNGYTSIYPASYGASDLQFDVELLYKAALSNPTYFSRFNKK